MAPAPGGGSAFHSACLAGQIGAVLRFESCDIPTRPMPAVPWDFVAGRTSTLAQAGGWVYSNPAQWTARDAGAGLVVRRSTYGVHGQGPTLSPLELSPATPPMGRLESSPMGLELAPPAALKPPEGLWLPP